MDSASVLHGFAQERAMEWVQDYLAVPAARKRVIGILQVLATRSTDLEQRRYWRLTNDGAMVYAREGAIVSLRPDVAYGNTGIMDSSAREPATCTVIFSAPDRAEETGAIQAKFHFTLAELKTVFSAFDRSGLVHALYDERALIDATRLDRMEAAFEAFLAPA